MNFATDFSKLLVMLTRELRIACTVAQMEREGGISARISPLAQVLHDCKMPSLNVSILGEQLCLH